MAFDSVYDVTYDPDSRTVLLVDLADSSTVQVLDYMAYRAMNLSHFGQQRSQNIDVMTCACRPLRISWKSNQVAVQTQTTDPYGEFMKKHFSIEAIAGDQVNPIPDPGFWGDWLDTMSGESTSDAI